MKISFTVPGKVKSKPPPKSFSPESSKRIFVYQPKDVKVNQLKIQEYFVSKYPDYKFLSADYMRKNNIALEITIFAYYQIPKHTSVKKTKLMLEGLILPTVRPDYDNIEKLLNDALNGVAFADDSFIAEAQFYKRYAHQPRLEVTIEEIDNTDNPSGKIHGFQSNLLPSKSW